MLLNVLPKHDKDYVSQIPGNPESFKVHRIVDIQLLSSSKLYNKK